MPEASAEMSPATLAPAPHQAGSDPAPTLLATWPASRRERQLALGVVLVSLAFFLVAVPFAKRPLTPVWGFIPIYESALVLNDLITAVLLFGQFRFLRSKAILVLAAGYLYTASITVVHALSFPGLFAPGGLLGAGPQSTAWLYMFWHGGFPLFVIAYALWRGSERETLSPGLRVGWPVAGACAAAAAATAAVTLAVTVGQAWLPPIMQGSHYTPAMAGVVTGVWLASVGALVLLWRRKPHRVLETWLMVVMCTWLCDIALSAMLNAGRFDLGFYAGRVYGLLASSFVLGVLLLENGLLHRRLLLAHVHERQRAADLQQLSRRLESVNTQLGDSNQLLQEQTRLKSEFLANMSHELRTPLNAVIGFSEMLKDGMAGPVTDRQRTFAGHINDGGHHLLALINDILDLSKIEAGKAELMLEDVDLDAVLAEVGALTATQAQAKGVHIHVAICGRRTVLRADRRRLKQIVLNLVANAMKFTPAGGRVSVAAQPAHRTRAATALPGFSAGIRLPLPEGDIAHFIEISITDTGIGIAPGDMHKLFTPFTQITNAATRGVEGTGLGLAMVHQLAALHGGTAAVTSEAGRGSCFTVWLPWHDGPAPGTSDDSAEAEKPLPVCLIVEDNMAAAVLMRVQLEALGFDVRQVESAEAALSLANQFVPALITLDVVLPGMDGWEFLAQMKTLPQWAAVPVVVVSVLADKDKGFSLGAAQVLQKPITRDMLMQSLTHLGLTQGTQRQITVLVVDDDPAAVELLAGQLLQHDCVVLRALGGREGIELAQRFRPDMITLDLDMPDVNGFAVVQALKGDAATAHIPIVVVTSKDLSDNDRRQLSAHILDIVGKCDLDARWFAGEVQRALARAA